MPIDDLKMAMDQTHIGYPIVLDDLSQTWQLNSIDNLPMTFIIDPQGHVAKRIVGVSTEKSLLATIRELQKIQHE